jgi:hypothetical protein
MYANRIRIGKLFVVFARFQVSTLLVEFQCFEVRERLVEVDHSRLVSRRIDSSVYAVEEDSTFQSRRLGGGALFLRLPHVGGS